MKVFVTGATGYIGEAVVTHLNSRGHTVLGLTRDTNSSGARSLSDAGIRMLSGDIGDPATYREHLGIADVVIHTVSDKNRPTEADRDLFAEILAVHAEHPEPHLIYTTGCSVFGAHSHDLLTEETPTDPHHPRAILENELRSTGLPHTIVRPAFVFGRDGRSSLLGRWLDTSRKDRDVFYGDPTKTWSWVHVDDLARAYAAIISDLPAHDGATFLIADEVALPALETFRACQRIDGQDRAIILAPIENEDELYQIFDRDEIVDARKARDRLQWTVQAGTVLDFIESRQV